MEHAEQLSGQEMQHQQNVQTLLKGLLVNKEPRNAQASPEHAISKEELYWCPHYSSHMKALYQR